MGNLKVDTAVTPSEHPSVYTAELSRAWEIWGPAGGYVAGIALRAAGAVSRFDRPANCAVQFLGVATFDRVDLHTEILRATRRADVVRVVMRQADRDILQLTVWVVSDEQLDRVHRDAEPSHQPLATVPTVAERLAAAGLEPNGNRHGFWNNFEERPLSWVDDWENRGILPPRWETWLRYLDDPVTDDPFLEAARLLLLVDLGGWPAAHRAYPDELASEWYAPSLDVACQFVDLDTTEWLAVLHHSPVGQHGLLNASGQVWSEDGRLLASGITQLLATPTRR